MARSSTTVFFHMRTKVNQEFQAILNFWVICTMMLQLGWLAQLAITLVICGSWHGAEASSCYPLQSGESVSNRENVALAVCLPGGSTLNCDHCTHAGERTSCWALDSRCLSRSTESPYKIQNWGYSSDEVWTQNFDDLGNAIYVPVICVDQYGGTCFSEVESSGSIRVAPPRQVLWVFNIIMVLTVTGRTEYW